MTAAIEILSLECSNTYSIVVRWIVRSPTFAERVLILGLRLISAKQRLSETTKRIAEALIFGSQTKK